MKPASAARACRPWPAALLLVSLLAWDHAAGVLVDLAERGDRVALATIADLVTQALVPRFREEPIAPHQQHSRPGGVLSRDDVPGPQAWHAAGIPDQNQLGVLERERSLRRAANDLVRCMVTAHRIDHDSVHGPAWWHTWPEQKRAAG